MIYLIKIINKSNFASSWIKLWSIGTSFAWGSSGFCWSNCRDGEGVGGGLGWVNVNGNSTDKSLFNQTIQFNLLLKIIYPPIATTSFILTLYCTIIPRFSFWVLFRILF